MNRRRSQQRLHDATRKDDPDRKFLQSRRWREKIRPAFLYGNPLCIHCTLLGRVAVAEEIDHVTRPRGDHRLQTDPANFQPLCKDHHQAKSLWERRNEGREIPEDLIIGHDADGWPIRLRGGQALRG